MVVTGGHYLGLIALHDGMLSRDQPAFCLPHPKPVTLLFKPDYTVLSGGLSLLSRD